ncbi:hypothetical protein SRB5_39160 [Streptomyces sp. RB5]|uniref:Uncharacterized protein n=1 Tax=Streptomyces smaragdinus TaxID=2585196 RepID=A0A7K0CLX0_9ACTN|nr:hypothetical protein [Streptomyces smaragdinus]MQY13764.1 hypothetical protein [Streptomyces smaragdinus]
MTSALELELRLEAMRRMLEAPPAEPEADEDGQEEPVSADPR